MASSKLSSETRRIVRERAQNRCEYCRTSEWLSGFACEIDHITPISKDGADELDNLCLACSACNGYKWARTEAIDPETNRKVAMFHPRQQTWHEHFAWREEGQLIVGLTPCGRATVATLQMNHELIVAARTIWIQIGLHPPD